MVGASNELPETEELDALYDRFLIRRQFDPPIRVSDRRLVKAQRLLKVAAYTSGRLQVVCIWQLGPDTLRNGGTYAITVNICAMQRAPIA
ncbi:hypothetical protein WJX73_005292 [Symbiochloris irregularis]|uniref:ATPase RavA-like AAA lid domain-containing protein n=1 Tax=Symbiochloris irregularis TaxID=706552 RepID=A0AAW1NLZ9_9CHLO